MDPAPSDIIPILMAKVLDNVGNKIVAAFEEEILEENKVFFFNCFVLDGQVAFWEGIGED